jgi:HlyD family secretion protein
MKRILIAAIVLIGLAAAFEFPRSKTSADTPLPGQPAASPARIVAPGRVEPLSEEIKIGAEIDGRLQSVPVDEGSTVRRGQVIATLSRDTYAARVETAQAELRARIADLEHLQNGSRPMERDQARAALAEAEAWRDQAATERQRRLSILDLGAISRVEFEVSDREYKVAQARVDAARQHLALLNAEARAEDVAKLKAEIERARAQLHEAQADLNKTAIYSPIDGIVLHRYLQAGESVSRSSGPIVTLGDTSRLRVRMDVDEADVAHLRTGQRAYVTAAAYGDRRFTGVVSRIGQMLGKKRVRTDEPSERVDTKVLETLIDLDPGSRLPLGLRVDAFIEVVN